MRRAFYAAVALVAFSGFQAPEVKAQSLDLSSSMTALCLGATCETVQFTLDVVGTTYLNIVNIFSGNAGLWQFGSVLEIVDGTGNIVTSSFVAGVSADQLVLSAGSLIPPFLFAEPLRLTVQMATFSTGENLFNGSLTYTANGEIDPVFDGDGFFSVSGTVTPEPSTVFLLGTGLLGLTGMAWRRRKDADLEEA